MGIANINIKKYTKNKKIIKINIIIEGRISTVIAEYFLKNKNLYKRAHFYMRNYL